jgi:hypothetical protein
VKSGNVKRATIVGAAFFATDMGGGRELLGETLVRARRVEDFWAPGLSLVHDARIFELFDKSFLPPGRTSIE